MKVFVDGSAGTTGLEIVERLGARAEYSLIRLDEADRKSADARRAAMAEADVTILCLPDEAAREAVAMAPSSTRIIDASSAHRTAAGWTYGFPELGHDVAGAHRISNPGCYPTGFLALVAPLVRAGLIDPTSALQVHAVSGYSGGGKVLIERYAWDAGLAHRLYGFGAPHKHVAEMQRYAGLTVPPLFAPSVTRAHRGMLVEVAVAGLERETVLATWEATFAGAVVTTMREPVEELTLHDGEEPWDGMALHALPAGGGAYLRLIAVLDNLGKGASGAAVQNLNLMAGLPATAGLHLARSPR